MTVYELMTELSQMPAGAQVVVTEEHDNWRNAIAVVTREDDMVVSIIGDGDANLRYADEDDD